ncbi:histamine H1 receptor [Elysia marginata]|uniref:Histamine H1 receptor n=1 Tax=Elysia marginata TaxID=1093978 RepID=A0AAV4HI86_9GAST|nr:histamine H1 receptor [Elysia marginata]
MESSSQESELSNRTRHIDEDHTHASDAISKTVISSVALLTAVFIVCGNLGTLVSFGRCRRLQTIPNMYVCSLALADILVGCVVFIRAVLGLPATGAEINDKYICLCFVSFTFTSVAASIFGSTLVACDRYVFIQHPLRYEALVTRNTSLACIISTWCLAVIYGFLPMHWNEFDEAEDAEDCAPTHIYPFQYMIVIHPIMFLSLSAVTFTVYLKIFRIALRHHKCIHAQNVSVQNSTNSCSIRKSTKENLECLAHVRTRSSISSAAISPQGLKNQEAMAYKTRRQQQQQPVVVTVQEYRITSEITLPSSFSPKQFSQSHNCCSNQVNQNQVNDTSIKHMLHPQEVAKQQMQQPQTQQTLDRSLPQSSCGQASLDLDLETKRVTRAGWKMIKAMVLTFGLFFLCWCPMLVVAYIEYTIHVSHLALSLASLVGILNSGKNCLVLVAMNRDFRSQFKLLFCCNFFQSKPDQVSSVTT